MEKHKKISIIIPTYNRKEKLEKCIDSILNQTYHNFEIIIVDDGSTDGTQEWLEAKYKTNSRIIYLINSQNSGAGFSRKRGYDKAQGEYIIFCDDDDYYTDNEFFSEAVRIFEKENIMLICSNSYTRYESEDKYVLHKLNFNNLISTHEYLENFQYNYQKPNSTFSTIFRKDSLEKSNFHSMHMVNDSSIYLRSLLNEGKVFVNEKAIGVYRIHDKNITFNLKADFLVENLEEKKYIYHKIIENQIFKDPDTWFEQQIRLTVEYFLRKTVSSKQEKEKIFTWIKENDKQGKKLVFQLKLFFIKRNIKNILKNVVNIVK